MVSMLFLLVCMPLNMVYGLFCYFLLFLCFVLCFGWYLLRFLYCFLWCPHQLHLLVLYLRLHVFLPMPYASGAFTRRHRKRLYEIFKISSGGRPLPLETIVIQLNLKHLSKYYTYIFPYYR